MKSWSTWLKSQLKLQNSYNKYINTTFSLKNAFFSSTVKIFLEMKNPFPDTKNLRRRKEESFHWKWKARALEQYFVNMWAKKVERKEIFSQITHTLLYSLTRLCAFKHFFLLFFLCVIDFKTRFNIVIRKLFQNTLAVNIFLLIGCISWTGCNMRIKWEILRAINLICCITKIHF